MDKTKIIRIKISENSSTKIFLNNMEDLKLQFDTSEYLYKKVASCFYNSKITSMKNFKIR